MKMHRTRTLAPARPAASTPAARASTGARTPARWGLAALLYTAAGVACAAGAAGTGGTSGASGTAGAASPISGAGFYDAQLCVATSAQPPGCGPAEAEWRNGGWAQVRVSDIAYRLQLHSSQVDVSTLHGAMEIDAFTANFEWDGRTLRFTDTDKNVRYEVTWGARKAASR